MIFFLTHTTIQTEPSTTRGPPNHSAAVAALQDDRTPLEEVGRFLRTGAARSQQNRLALDLTQVARDIHVRQLRKFRIPNRIFQAVVTAFVGGKLNYYAPWLSSEPTDTIKPLEIAYRHYMRVYSGAFTSTPISHRMQPLVSLFYAIK